MRQVSNADAQPPGANVTKQRLLLAVHRTLKGVPKDGPKVRKKFEFRTISIAFTSPIISVTAKNRGLQAAYVAFSSGHATLPDSIRIRIGRPDSIRFESDGPIRKFRIAAPATFAVVP